MKRPLESPGAQPTPKRTANSTVTLYVRDIKVFPSARPQSPDEVVVLANDTHDSVVTDVEYYIRICDFMFSCFAYPTSGSAEAFAAVCAKQCKGVHVSMGKGRRMCNRSSHRADESAVILRARSVRALLGAIRAVKSKAEWHSGPTSAARADECLADIGIRRGYAFRCRYASLVFVEPGARHSRISEHEAFLRAGDVMSMPDQAFFDYVPRIAYFDIETDYPKERKHITCISACVISRNHASWRAFVVENGETQGPPVSTEEVKRDLPFDAEDLRVMSAPSEKEMLKQFFAFLSEQRVHIVTAYNGWAFDVQLIMERCGCARESADAGQVTSARTCTLDPFPLSRRQNDALAMRKKSFWTAGKGYRTLVEFLSGVVGIVHFDALPVCTMSPQKVGNPSDAKLNTLATKAFPGEPHMTKDYLPYPRLSEAWRKNRRKLLVYVIRDTFVLWKTLTHYDLTAQVISEARLLNMSEQTLCSCGESQRFLAALNCMGREQAVRGTLPMFAPQAEEAPKSTLEVMVGFSGVTAFRLDWACEKCGAKSTRLEQARACFSCGKVFCASCFREDAEACPSCEQPRRLAPLHHLVMRLLQGSPPEGVKSVLNWYHKGATRKKRTLLVCFESEEHRSRILDEWKGQKCTIYQGTIKQAPRDVIPGGYVRTPTRLPDLSAKEGTGKDEPVKAVGCLDFASLYPSLMRSFNICKSTTARLRFWRESGYKDQDLFIMPRRHELCRLTWEELNPHAIPNPPPCLDKNWPYGVEHIAWDDERAILAFIRNSDYNFVCSTPEILQLEERVTPDTIASLRPRILVGDIPQAIQIQLNARKDAKKKMAECYERGDARMATVWNNVQMLRKASANSAYGVCAARTGLLSDRCTGEVIPQRGNWAQMRLTEILYTTDWAARFDAVPALPRDAPCKSEEWSLLCAELARVLRGNRLRVVYGDTDSIFLHLPITRDREVHPRLLCSAFLYFANTLTHEGFSDYCGDPLPHVKLEAEKLIVNYISMGQKRYGGILYDCETGRPMRGDGSSGKDEIAVFVREPESEASKDTLAALEERVRVRVVEDEHGAQCVIGGCPAGEQFVVCDKPSILEGPVVNASDVEYACIKRGLIQTLKKMPKVEKKGFVKRSFDGNMKELIGNLFYHAVCLNSPAQTLVDTTIRFMKTIANDSRSPSAYMLTGSVSKNPQEGFSEWLKADDETAKGLRVCASYKTPNAALAAFRRDFQQRNQTDHDEDEDEKLGEEATRDRISYFVDASWDERDKTEKMSSFYFPKTCYILTEGERKPSVRYELYEYLKNTVKVFFDAAGASDKFDGIFHKEAFVPRQGHGLYRAVLLEGKSPFPSAPVNWKAALSRGVDKWLGANKRSATREEETWLSEVKEVFGCLGAETVPSSRFQKVLPNSVKEQSFAPRFSCECPVCGGDGEDCCGTREAEEELARATDQKERILSLCIDCRRSTPGCTQLEELREVTSQKLRVATGCCATDRDIEDLALGRKDENLTLNCAVAACENSNCDTMMDRLHAVARVKRLRSVVHARRNEDIANAAE